MGTHCFTATTLPLWGQDGSLQPRHAVPISSCCSSRSNEPQRITTAAYRETITLSPMKTRFPQELNQKCSVSQQEENISKLNHQDIREMNFSKSFSHFHSFIPLMRRTGGNGTTTSLTEFIQKESLLKIDSDSSKTIIDSSVGLRIILSSSLGDSRFDAEVTHCLKH